jgi:AAA15 family ATPase/GTPase
MLIEFRVKNYRSFRDEQVLSLVATSDKSLNENCISEGQLKLLRAAAIYGANASGKSNLIKAAGTMRRLVLNSAGYEPGRKLGITPFLLDTKSRIAPSTFEVTFYEEGVRYQYGFSATSERIEEEWLVAYPRGVGQKWYERVFNKKPENYNWKYSSFLKGDKSKLAEKTRENALFLSVGAQWNNKQLATVYEWFSKKLRVIDSSHDLKPVTEKMLLDAKKKSDIPITNIMKEADLGISGVDVKMKEVDIEKIRFPKNMPDEIRSEIIRNIKESFEVGILHRNTETGEDVRIPLEEESDGTQEFFKLIGLWIHTCALGITVFIDELEASLHPLLTRELVRAIQHHKPGNKRAQLIFATHDTTLLDQKLFRRDQIWFTEKDKDGGTHLCPVSDYKLRKGEAMQKGYLSGRYGGVPILERFQLK